MNPDHARQMLRFANPFGLTGNQCCTAVSPDFVRKSFALANGKYKNRPERMPILVMLQWRGYSSENYTIAAKLAFSKQTGKTCKKRQQAKRSLSFLPFAQRIAQKTVDNIFISAAADISICFSDSMSF